MSRLLDLWPALATLDRLGRFLHRLEALPPAVGPIDLGVIRAIALPTPDTWPANPARPGSAPDAVDPAWLAGVLLCAPGEDDIPSRLWHITQHLGALPSWSLVRIWLLEVALAWSGDPPACQGELIADLGDLYCQTGDLVEGIKLIDQASELDEALRPARALRAARWVAQIHPETAAERLTQISSSAPDDVRLLAEVELLGLEAPSGERDDLLERARYADEVISRAARFPLAETDRRHLRIRAHQIVARWFASSRIRPFREAGRERLAQALKESREAGDFRALALTLDMLGRSHLRGGSLVEARAMFGEAVALKQRLRDLWGLGASLTGLADCLLAAGLARESLPYFQANLLLLDRLGGMEVLFVRNLARHLNALVAASCNPLESSAPSVEILELATQLRHEYRAFAADPERDPYGLLLEGGYRRLAARRADRPEQWHDHLSSGIDHAQRAHSLFRAANNSQRTAEASRTLAALLLDRVGLTREQGMCGLTEPEDLEQARVALEDADHHTQGDQARLQAELLWARYHQLIGNPYRMQLHLAAARRGAESSGLQAVAVEVDARLGVKLVGPSPSTEAVVVALPGEVLPLEIRATDWRGRPLPNFAVHGFIEAHSGPTPTLTPEQQRTDSLGRARFEVCAGAPGRSVFHAATTDGVHVTTINVVVRPMQIERPIDPRPPAALSASHSRLVRQLFGPDCPRLRILREFTTGRTGTRVLLVEPFRDGEQGEELRAQPCIVKLGPRSLLEDEQKRYRHWVKELLPLNVSRLDGFSVWQDEAALRLGLVGDARGQVREACEWLATVEAFDAHLLLERVFVGDLAACWYANNPRQRKPATLAELYGPMLPCLVQIEDDHPPRGLTAAGDPVPTSARIEDGLRPEAARSFHTGDELTIQGTVRDYRPAGSGWEYELRLLETPLRVSFLSSLPPDLAEPDGAPERLFDGRRWSVRGQVKGTAFERLRLALIGCIEAFNQTHAGETVAESEDGRYLLFTARGVFRRASNPLAHLGRLLSREIACHWSPIHGDLHGRNVLVGGQGQPFYIDFARTGHGPTLFDFIKFEVYLWHENFADWPAGCAPPNVGLAEAIELLDDLASADPARHFPSPYARRGAQGKPGWPGLFRQCVATVRSAARPYVVEEAGADYFIPLTLYTALMLRWCDPAKASGEARRVLARQGVMHALVAGMLLDGVLEAMRGR